MHNVPNSKGFTLFELLIVIVIIGLIYGLFVSNLQNKEVDSDAITLLSMKKTLLNQPFKRQSDIICFEPCQECFIYNDSQKSESEAFSLFNAPPKVYVKDQYDRLELQQFLPFKSEGEQFKDVCFRFTLFNNKSSSHFIVENEKKFYLFHPYMADVQELQTLPEAEKLFSDKTLLPKDSRDYDF
jgi:prepilin-type N-terminal cleavage/methylation domain-containing protein